MRAARREKDFAIALELLSEAPPPLAWANLGDWSSAARYDDACQALALRVGAAAALQAGDRVLDLACGHGASLRLWPQAFGAHRVTGLEYQARCVERIRRHAPAGLEAIVQGRFDALPPPAVLPAGGFDAAVCVDAAYHAVSLHAFAAFAAQLLRSQGRLAFTTLLAPAPPAGRQHGPWRPLPFLLARAGIPPASVLCEAALVEVLTEQGFTAITLQRLDVEVLQGFAAFVQRRRQVLSWRQQAGAGWLKIAATAWLCRHLHASGALHYCLVSATRRE
ncbi:MAG: class I SAM-dependent methyltransferase [Pseudomonadota bacterium]